MSSYYTPGPWSIATTGTKIRIEPIRATLDLWSESGSDEQAKAVNADRMANARLIAAAPDLLDAVGELICSLDAIYPDLETELMGGIENSTSAHGANLIDSYRLTINAIAKAEGGAS